MLNTLLSSTEGLTFRDLAIKLACVLFRSFLCVSSGRSLFGDTLDSTSSWRSGWNSPTTGRKVKRSERRWTGFPCRLLLRHDRSCRCQAAPPPSLPPHISDCCPVRLHHSNAPLIKLQDCTYLSPISSSREREIGHSWPFFFFFLSNCASVPTLSHFHSH